MGTNKVATVVLFDVSRTMAAETDNGETFFVRSLNCLKRMILRKIFSQDFDDMGVVLFGSDNTNNNLANGTSSCYRNIEEFFPLSLADWNLYERVENLQMSSVPKSDWIQGLVAAQDFMKNQTQGRKYRTKQLVVFCNLNTEISVYVEAVNPIVKALESENVNFIVIGNDIADDCEGKELDSQVSGSLRLMFQCITNLKDAVHFSFSDIEKDLKYYEKKRKMIRFYSISLNIGSRIQLPVRWMKVNKEATRFKWEVLNDNVISEPRYQQQQKSGYLPQQTMGYQQQQKMDETKIEFETDTVKHTNFGGTIIDLSYADLEALKRNTGPPSLTYLGSVKSGRISRSMFVGKDQYVLIADKSARAVAMFSAFVDALLKAKKYGLARRIASKNGKIVVGALLPVSDDFGKALYFLKLPYSEYVQHIPIVHLPISNNTEAKKAINDLIDNTMLPDDLLEEDKGILLRDPSFQARCHALYLRAMGKLPPMSFIPLPETVQQIMNPSPLNDEANEALKKIAEIFPYTEPEEKAESPKRKPKPKETITGSSHIDYKFLAKGNLGHHPALEYSKMISVNNKQEIKEIIEFANAEYDDIFSEEMS
ncbi:unnamed protein product [Nezara viridula]|uniref:VWFA domain-containing protein n=1 Tax=Nezara viridula TaxID=85310 RepID=A0A9P0MUS8_NEZVI|nr:unnamed protein product [Nezara viridula]